MGSARAVNRRYISDCVPLKIRMQASAGFVSASALGMACGPALSGLLQIHFKIYYITVNQNTSPGWVMTLAWLAYLFWLWISFREPVRHIEENNVAQHSDPGKFHPIFARGLICTLYLFSCKPNIPPYLTFFFKKKF